MKYTPKILYLIIPFLVMIIINEIIRPSIKEEPHSMLGITAFKSS